MAGIDKTNIRTMATDIARQLDNQDSNKGDGKIEASIWNEFVADKGGRQIRNSITLGNAIKSITTYIARNATKTGESFGDIADKWFNKTAPIEKVVTPPVRQVPASELPPQQFKMPENIPEVKPLPYTEEDLEEMFVKPGQDVLEHREAGKVLGETIALLINNGSSYEEEVNPKDAAYTFSELIAEIPDLAEKFGEGQTQEIVQNIYNGLIKRTEELGINLLEETGLDSIDIEDATPDEQIKVCKAISDVISAHDESAINEMNMYQSIKTPNPELAGKTIEDKASGKMYIYDEKGEIKEIKDNEGNIILRTVDYEYAKRKALRIDNEYKTEVELYYDNYTNRIKLEGSYSENYEDDGFTWHVERKFGGKLESVEKLDENYNEVESWDHIIDDSFGHWKRINPETTQVEDYDENGNLEYYQEMYQPTNGNMLRTYREKDGSLIGTMEEVGKLRAVGSSQIYRNADGELLATIEYSPNKSYKDADGNEISEEQFNELVDERLR
jgi:hypothetical protein